MLKNINFTTSLDTPKGMLRIALMQGDKVCEECGQDINKYEVLRTDILETTMKNVETKFDVFVRQSLEMHIKCSCDKYLLTRMKYEATSKMDYLDNVRVYPLGKEGLELIGKEKDEKYAKNYAGGITVYGDNSIITIHNIGDLTDAIGIKYTIKKLEEFEEDIEEDVE